MPYNRKRRCNAQSKQKKLITSRLMEISLKVDDYVYNNKIIAESDAVQYIQEVTSYRPLCSNDQRCLQVIEKLTRIMNGIISEQRDLPVGNIFNENSSFANSYQTHGSISPVYSTPDEDRTQFTPVAPDSIVEAKEDISPRDKQIIDLCDSDDEILQKDKVTQEIPSMVVEVVIHRGISNRSPTPTNAGIIHMTPDIEECSQSILKNCDNIGINVAKINHNSGTVQETLSDGTCSQSILKHFENTHINIERMTRNTENVPSKEITTAITNDNETNIMRTTDPIDHTLQHNKVATVANSAIPKPNDNLTLTIDPPQNTISNMQYIGTTAMIATSTSNNKLKPESLYNKNVTTLNYPLKVISGNTVECNLINKINVESNIVNKNVSKNLQNNYDLKKNCKVNDNYCSNESDNTTRSDNIHTQLHTDVVSNRGNNKSQIKNKSNANKNKRYKSKKSTLNATSYVYPALNEVNEVKPTNTKDNPDTTKKKSRKKKSEESLTNNDKITFKKPPVKRTLKNKKVTKFNEIIQVYNNSTENDLSWVENIRFVREINENEYDRQFVFGDDFWDNCSIPGICDDHDFNY